MLAYLEELCAALLAHETIAIHRLLGHPLARSLPRQVREEALAISRANSASLRAPIQTLRFYHQTLQLGETDAASEAASGVTEAAEADVGAQPAAPPEADPAPSAALVRGVVVESQREQIELPFARGGAVAA